MITVAALDRPGLSHGFFTRAGGVSEGIFASLNCGLGSSDDAASVAENRRRALTQLGFAADRLATCYQVHGAEVAAVTAPWRHEDRPRADAMVTATPGVALGILTADCAPVLFADPAARVIGAAHAGWRGALSGVLEATVAAMERQGATAGRISAAIGPCIGTASYEVGAEFPRFRGFDPARAESLAEALWPAIAKPETARAFRAAAEPIARPFTLEGLADNYLDAYEKVLSAKRAQGWVAGLSSRASGEW